MPYCQHIFQNIQLRALAFLKFNGKLNNVCGAAIPID